MTARGPAGGAPPGPDAAPRDGAAALAQAWSAILATARLARSAPPSGATAAFAPDGSGGLRPVAAGDPAAWVLWRRGAGWAAGGGWPAGTRDLLDLYLPVLPAHPQAAISVAHLGQSLDGYIATPGGESRFVTGPGNILHLHRMRALSDAVLAGAETVALDDPRLTTRLVAGDNPVRVVLDPRRRLGVDRQVFRDGAAPTLLVCAQGRQGPPARHGQAEVMAVPATRGRLDLAALVAGLHARGLRRLFVEGGGVSVSAFLAAGLLDRLQVTVAPLLIGEGRRGLSLPAPASLGECLRPPCRVFRMGEDVLFDCEPMRPGPARNPRATPAVARVR